MARGRGSRGRRGRGARGHTRTITRYAGSGRFAPRGAATRSPRTTTRERVGRGTRNARPVYRSATTGRFVSAAAARRNPGGTIRQMV